MSRVRFGVILANDPEDESRGETFVQKIFDYLDNLDDIYESVWVPDHLLPTHPIPPRKDDQVFRNDYLECLTTTSYLMPLYPRLKFGQAVICNSFRNPALLAKMTSTLQVLSGGRFILGIGAGWYPFEHIQYGYNFPPPWLRVKKLDEAIQIIKIMWTEDNVTFHGKHYHIENAYCNPKPNPIPPIMIGGGGEKVTLRIVAKYADWWSGNFLDETAYAHKLSVLSKHCDKVGRDFDDIVKCSQWCVAVADSDEEALKIAKQSQYYHERLYLVGTPETISSQLGKLVDVGVDYLQIYFPQYNNVETSKLFAQEVIPEIN